MDTRLTPAAQVAAQDAAPNSATNSGKGSVGSDKECVAVGATQVGGREIAGAVGRSEHAFPKVFGECIEAGWGDWEPCPFIACTHHMAAIRIVPGDGWQVVIGTPFTAVVDGVVVPDLERMPATCALQQIRHEGAHTLEMAGELLGVTRERVRQIEAKAERKLRHPTRTDELRPFLREKDLALTATESRALIRAQRESAVELVTPAPMAAPPVVVPAVVAPAPVPAPAPAPVEAPEAPRPVLRKTHVAAPKAAPVEPCRRRSRAVILPKPTGDASKIPSIHALASGGCSSVGIAAALGVDASFVRDVLRENKGASNG